MTDPRTTLATGTTTGGQLAARLRLVGGAAAAGEIPRHLGEAINAALDQFERDAEYDRALMKLCGALDPSGAMGHRALADRIEGLMSDFRGIDRVRLGFRKPNTLERLLLPLMDEGRPRTGRRLAVRIKAIRT